MKAFSLFALLLALVALALVGQDNTVTRPHHRNAEVLTWSEAGWSPLREQIIGGSVQVFRNGLALADQIDYSYSMDSHVFTLFVSKPDDVILVTYDAN
jgi:hypothetical protein